MANFKELNTNLNLVIQMMLENKNLCKLLTYDTPDALQKPDLIGYEDYNGLLYTRIFPYPKDITNRTEANSIILVGLDNFNPIGNTFVSNLLRFRILCHESLWDMNDNGMGMKLRPYLIMQEIANLYNNQRVVGIGKLLLANGGELITNNGSYSGFHLSYKITEFS